MLHKFMFREYTHAIGRWGSRKFHNNPTRNSNNDFHVFNQFYHHMYLEFLINLRIKKKR